MLKCSDPQKWPQATFGISLFQKIEDKNYSLSAGQHLIFLRGKLQITQQSRSYFLLKWQHKYEHMRLTHGYRVSSEAPVPQEPISLVTFHKQRFQSPSKWQAMYEPPQSEKSKSYGLFISLFIVRLWSLPVQLLFTNQVSFLS